MSEKRNQDPLGVSPYLLGNTSVYLSSPAPFLDTDKIAKDIEITPDELEEYYKQAGIEPNEIIIEYGLPEINNEIVLGDLMPESARNRLATVSENDVEEAKQKWRDNPPLEDFENILDTEQVED